MWWRRLSATGPWLALILLVLIPLYAISAAFAIRSDLFDLSRTQITDEEYKAIWPLIASGLATSATVVGLLLARSHNERTLAFQEDIENRKLASQREVEERNAIYQAETSSRLALDTVVKCLELLVVEEGKYAPKARMAGTLAALIHLGHPVIAMRTLGAAWEEDAVESATACWLIGEVFQSGSNVSRREGSRLLRGNAHKLGAIRGHYDWPPPSGNIGRENAIFTLGRIFSLRLQKSLHHTRRIGGVLVMGY
jgi:hypothetical protein